MGPVVQVAAPGVVLVVTCAVVVGAGVVAALVVARSARRRRRALDEALARSRDEVEVLCRRVDELSTEVVRARRTADLDREYVITSLGVDEPERASDQPAALAEGGTRQPVGSFIEDQLVQALARQPRTSALRTRAVELVVRTVSLGHGVRRALSADVLDRAAAEAHVARRRSRRQRRRQAREARRGVRTDQVRGREVA